MEFWTALRALSEISLPWRVTSLTVNLPTVVPACVQRELLGVEHVGGGLARRPPPGGWLA